MNRNTLLRAAAAALALGAAAFGTAAHAGTYVQAQVQVAPPAHVHAVPQGPVYYAQDWGRDHDRRWRRDRDDRRFDGCRAARWDPNRRYLPGDTVWRQGHLYTATRLSARVWNVNSPPEWTPNYWVPARCD